MVIISWYNIIAILVGLLFVACFYSVYEKESHGAFYDLYILLKKMLILALAVVFYVFWGGIFWW